MNFLSSTDAIEIDDFELFQFREKRLSFTTKMDKWNCNDAIK